MIQKIWPLWIWPVIIICSAVATKLVTSVLPEVAVRPLVVMWFLFVCPGMALVRLFRLQKMIVEWMLALALSIAIEAIVASILLYTGQWSPFNILDILIDYCLIGAYVQLALIYLPPPRLTTRR